MPTNPSIWRRRSNAWPFQDHREHLQQSGVADRRPAVDDSEGASSRRIALIQVEINLHATGKRRRSLAFCRSSSNPGLTTKSTWLGRSGFIMTWIWSHALRQPRVASSESASQRSRWACPIRRVEEADQTVPNLSGCVCRRKRISTQETENAEPHAEQSFRARFDIAIARPTRSSTETGSGDHFPEQREALHGESRSSATQKNSLGKCCVQVLGSAGELVQALASPSPSATDL